MHQRKKKGLSMGQDYFEVIFMILFMFIYNSLFDTIANPKLHSPHRRFCLRSTLGGGLMRYVAPSAAPGILQIQL